MEAESVRVVLSHYALSGVAVRRVEALENAGGWSGSRLWRVTANDSRELCLRRWPAEHPTVERLQLIHAVLGLVSVELPMVVCPQRTMGGATLVEHEGHLWELTNWLPGAADFHANPSRARLRAAMQVLARFHMIAGRCEPRRGVAPAIAERQRRVTSLRENELAVIDRSLATPLGNDLDDRAVRLLGLAGEAFERAKWLQSLAHAPEFWLQPAIRDVHHDHVLFSGEEVTGLIDFGAMKMDTPLTDVARLVGSLVGDDAAMRKFALDAYSELRTLNDEDRQWIEVLDHSGVVLGALNWLLWLYVERRDMGPVGPIVRRMDEISRRLEGQLANHF